MLLNEIVKYNYENRPNRKYIYEKVNDKYKGITFKSFISKVNYLAYYLLDNNLEKKNILIIGKNSVNYMIADLAVTCYVGVVVHVSKDLKEKELSEIISKLDVSAVIYDGDYFIDGVKEVCEDVKFICMNEFNKIYRKYKDKELFDFSYRDENECVKIYLSSGTTGIPKSIMLSQKNILSGWDCLKRRADLNENDVCYLFLPLHHTYAGIYNFLYSLIGGFSIYLSTGIKNIANELQEVNPTIFCAVPMVYRMMYEKAGEHLKYAFGKNIKYMFSGGSKFPVEVKEVYRACNLPIFEAYALTETSASLCIAYLDDDINATGTVFENIEVIIKNADDNGVGEIAVKGENIFLGYYKNKELTDKVFDENGYFLTGDLGYKIDNKLYVVGRKKRVLLSENGENIYPEEIEIKLKDMCANITHVKIYLRDNKLFGEIYVNSEADINSVVSKYNEESQKKNIITDYVVIFDSLNTRLK